MIYPASCTHARKVGRGRDRCQIIRSDPAPTPPNWQRDTYLGQSDVGHDDGVQRAGGVAQRLVLVTVGVVLVLVDLAVVVTLPGHGAVRDAHVALGVDGGGLLAEIPGFWTRVSNCCSCCRQDLRCDWRSWEGGALGFIFLFPPSARSLAVGICRYRIRLGREGITIQRSGKHRT